MEDKNNIDAARKQAAAASTGADQTSPASAYRYRESNLLKAFGMAGICALLIFETFDIAALVAGSSVIGSTDGELLALVEFGSAHIIALTVGCVIGWVLIGALAVFEMCAAGHQKGREGIGLCWLDKIPFDLLTFLMLCILSIYFALGLDCSAFFPFPQVSLFPSIGFFSCFVCGAAIMTAFYFLSLARRVKAHAFLKNNIIFWICHGIKKFLLFLWKLIPNFWKRMMLLLALVIVQIVLLVRYADASWGWGEIPHTWVFVLVLLLTIAFVLWSWWMQKQCFEEAQAIRAGDLSKKIPEEKLKYMTGSLKAHAEDLNSIRDGVEDAVAVRLKSEHLKTELITNVSHDIKTPLTSIISYVDLLSKEHTEEEEKQYIDVLKRQTERLRKLTEDVLEASKADSGNVEVHLEKTSAAEIVDQAVGEYKEKLDAANLTTVVDVPEDLYVTADGKLLWRVLRNLLSNTAKYSAPGSRVYITAAPAIPDSGYATIEIKNISKDMLNVSADELMERFIRGDSSRHTEGSGLGLDIAKSLTTLMGGFFEIAIDGDLFKAIVRLPQAK